MQPARIKSLLAGVLFMALGASTAFPQTYPDNVVIVLDASGSMSEKMRGTGVRKIDAAKAALEEVLAKTPQSTHIGLLVFSAKGVRDPWIYPLGPRNDRALMTAIHRPQPGGGTPLGRYIGIGANRLLEQRKKQFGYGTYRLLVVTDGQAGDQRKVDRYTPEVMARGIKIDVIGVDMQQDHTLATIVHSYRRADDPASLKQAISEVFAEVSQSQTDAAGEDAFAAIAPLPIEAAQAALQALATSGNEPIGRGAALEQPGSTRSTTAAVAHTHRPSKASKAVKKSFRRIGLPCCGVVLLLFIIVLVIVVSRLIRSK